MVGSILYCNIYSYIRSKDFPSVPLRISETEFKNNYVPKDMISYRYVFDDDNSNKKNKIKYNLNKVIVNYNKNVKPTLLCHLYLDDKTTRSQGNRFIVSVGFY